MAPTPFGSPDEDDIPNSWEPQDGVEDGAEAAETITEDTHWESDWGDPGKQHETKQVYND